MSDLTRISALAQRQRDLEDEIEELKEKLSQTQADLYKVSDELLPDALKEVGMASFTLLTGEKVEVNEVIEASIPAIGTCMKNPELWDRRNACIQWLEDNNHPIVKHEVVATFNKEEGEKAQEALDNMKRLTRQVKDLKNVHPQTLLAWARGQIQANLVIPEDLFGLRRYKRTSIVRNKGDESSYF